MWFNKRVVGYLKTARANKIVNYQVQFILFFLHRPLYWVQRGIVENQEQMMEAEDPDEPSQADMDDPDDMDLDDLSDIADLANLPPPPTNIPRTERITDAELSDETDGHETLLAVSRTPAYFATGSRTSPLRGHIKDRKRQSFHGCG